MKTWSAVSAALAAFFCITPLHAADFTFSEAWQQLLQHSDTLAAQQAVVARHEHLQEAAAKRHFPDIRLSGHYARLSDPLKIDAAKLEPVASMNPQVLGHALTSLAGTGQISPQFAHDIGVLLKSFAGQELQTATDISGRDIFTGSLQVIWPLFTGWRISAAADIASQVTEEAKAKLALVREEQFTALAKVYFGVVLAEQLLHTRKEAEKGLKIHYEHALALEKEGQIARVERLEAEAAYDRAKVEAGKAHRMLEIARLALTKTLQQEEEVQPLSPLFISEQLPEYATFVSQTLNDHPGLSLLSAKQAQAKGLIRAEKGRYFPSVYAFADYNLYKQDTILGESIPDWTAGLGMSMTLFDAQGRGEKLAAARAALSQTTSLRRQMERDLCVLVEKTWKEAMQALEEFHGLASSIALAQENVRLRQKGFSQGISTSLDVVDARLFLESVTSQRLVASYTYVMSLAKLLAMSGTTEEFTRHQGEAQTVLRPLPPEEKPSAAQTTSLP
ncbi:MAG: hypothetical protein CSA21_01470 [Deltaproteobacteria bacterium]|nr:MAG: hypothetical protein CSA21_01470 [Deltaproteobacteria bacterium]